MTTGLWFSVLNLSLKHARRIFRTLPLNWTFSQYLETLKHVLLQKSQRCVSNFAKQKANIPKTEQQMYRCHEPYLQILTHNLTLPVLLNFSVDTHCCCWDSDFVQLFNLVFHYGLESQTSHHYREDSGGFSIHHGKSWKIKIFPKPVERIAKSSSIDHIFMQSFCSSQRHFTWGNLLACCL